MSKLMVKKVISLSIMAGLLFSSSVNAKSVVKNTNSNSSRTKIQVKEKQEERKQETKEKQEERKQEVKEKQEERKQEVKEKQEERKQEVKEKQEERKQEIKEKQIEKKELKRQKKELMKSQYTEEELKALKETTRLLLEENEDIEVVPVENILMKKPGYKFDTPPVIKSGRLLIPVRAITEGFGANVTWNGEEQTVMVSKGDKEIIFNMENGTVYVNGEESVIDVPAQKINNRTVVPFRFIVEQLGLKVDYDQEDDTIEITDEEETTDETVEEGTTTEETTDETVEEGTTTEETTDETVEEGTTTEETTDETVEEGTTTEQSTDQTVENKTV